MIILGLWFHGWMESHMVHQLTLINNKHSPCWIWTESHVQQICAVDGNIHCHCLTNYHGRIFCRVGKWTCLSCHMFTYLDEYERKHTRKMRCAKIRQALLLTPPVNVNVSSRSLNSCHNQRTVNAQERNKPSVKSPFAHCAHALQLDVIISVQ